MVNENLTDEELLNITGGQAFLDKREIDANFKPPIIVPLYNIPPVIYIQ